MYLKEIQMENFKSFGKKLTVPFFPGFTAITGPNGSGKSNIADAILFVLGPKSSKVMRAERLTDLIFNGGKKQKNPAKYCKVSLVFDNTSRRMPVDSDEVVLTRMIKRAPLKNDPENYYSRFYINNRPATYSDFVNVLLHARVAGGGYNIVKQGDVTNLIEMGSIERRRIIDDIAGISDFDNDIKKAEKEKIEVDSNLERIRIILNEITSQIRQLKKDRDEAYRYKELKDQLYEIKAKIALKKKQDIEAQIAEVNKQIQSYENERSKIERKSRELKEQYNKVREELTEVEKKIVETGGDDVKEVKEKIENLRGEEIKVEERINYLNDEILELQEEQKKFKTNLQEVEKELNEYYVEKEELEKQINEKQTLFREKEKEYQSVKKDVEQSDDKSMDLAHELAKMREEYNEKNSEIHEFKLKRDRLIDKIEKLELHIAEIEETKNTYEFELKDINWQIEEYQKNFKEKNKELKVLEKKLFEKKKKEAELTEELTGLEKTILKLQREQSKLQAEYDVLQSMQSKYNRAVNEVLKARDNKMLTGVHGTIAELATVDEKYKTAIEIAAGSRMQSIVVDNDNVAAEAIKFLQKEKLGRATFLPLNKMVTGKPRGKALMVVKDPKSHGFAIDLVKFREEYRGAFWYVFGDTVIVDSLDDARRLMGGVRLVDLKGTLIESSGAMIGGSVSEMRLTFRNIDLGKLDEVTQKLHEAVKHQEEISTQLSELKKEIKNLEDKLQSIKIEGDVQLQVKELDVKKKEFIQRLEVLNKELNVKTEEKEKIEKEKNEIVYRIKEYEKRLQELEAAKEEKGQLLLKRTKKELSQKVRELEGEVSKLQETILTLNSEKTAVEKKIEILNEKKEEITSEFEKREKTIEEYKKSIEELKKSRSSYHDQLNALLKVEEKITSEIKDLTLKRDRIYKKAVSIENELDKINTRMESYYDLISRAEYRLPTLEETVKELEQELKLYNVEITDKKLPNVESLKDSMRVIEETMQELEPVNMRALEEYEHQSERKKKLEEDIKHLKEQKKNLLKLVDEITEKKKERFYEVFNAVNKNFKEIYAELSEGGEAELQLEDPDNLFESGLTIKARPRGKKVLLLSALSGGEKSIASLAFIFAIQRYDPSPFYVLDEVDMFLDGVNAEIVSKMVKQNARDSQFIMVTLRKIALKEADHIYGVTMRENGVSEMIGNIDPSTVGPQGEININRGGGTIGAS
ncbi:MAG: chromosome segregation protein SMC [Thermoplasmata archaeon]|nr:MAG: chromosome segregation protein SMC [Thermoplasmata archaeon]